MALISLSFESTRSLGTTLSGCIWKKRCKVGIGGNVPFSRWFKRVRTFWNLILDSAYRFLTDGLFLAACSKPPDSAGHRLCDSMDIQQALCYALTNYYSPITSSCSLAMQSLKHRSRTLLFRVHLGAPTPNLRRRRAVLCRLV